MGTGWQLDEEPEEPGPVVVGGGTAVEPPVGCDPLGPEDCEPVSPGPVVVAGPEVAQLPGLGGAVAQAQTRRVMVSISVHKMVPIFESYLKKRRQ